jgi:capsular polysaccharide biosynthesis protein
MDQRVNRTNTLNTSPTPAELRMAQNQRQDEELDLREIISLLLHHAWVIALAALAGALLVGLSVKIFVPAKYTARATIYVFSIEEDNSSQDMNKATKMTTDFQIIATTRTTIQKVIDELGEDMTVKELMQENTIKVTNPEGSHMLRISVTNRDPAEATKISNALASVMCDQIAYIMKSERPQFVEPAVMGSKTSPYVRRDALIGGIGFGLVAMIFVLVRYFVNDTITTEEDVNRYLGITILSSVPLERNMNRQ